MNLTILSDYGVDYKKGIARCLNDENFYGQLLTLFLEDSSFFNAKEAYEKKDYRGLFNYTHELKGACGNAALTDLYNAVSPLVELLRGGCEDQEKITSLFQQLDTAYNRTREGVSTALEK